MRNGAMLQNIKADTLAAELEKIIEHLAKENLIPKNIDIKALAKLVTESLEKSHDVVINPKSLLDPHILKTLCTACIAASNPNNKFDYLLLFKDDLKFDDANALLKALLAPEIAKRLGKELKDCPEINEKLNELIDDAVKVLDKNLNSDKKTELLVTLTKQIESKIIEEQQRDQRISDYGVDTHKPGAVITKVERVIGNLTGRQDLATFGKNAMAQNESIEGPDYQGTIGNKVTSVLNSLMDGVISSGAEKNMFDALSAEIDLHKTPTLKR